MCSVTDSSEQKPALPVNVVILAAGAGSRLGRSTPKSLTRLADHSTILGRQLAAIDSVWPNATVAIVVGFKLELIMESAADRLFVYNDEFDRTNTSQSLKRALKLLPGGPVVWMNGDVVLNDEVLRRFAEPVKGGESVIGIVAGKTGAEEVKYRLDAEGKVLELSKSVTDAAGESVGINSFSAAGRSALLSGLGDCSIEDYFERGIELAIDSGACVGTVDLSDLGTMEIDFESDLTEVNSRLADGSLSAP